MRASAALLCIVLVLGASGVAGALNQSGYSVGNAANYTSKVATISFTGNSICESNSTVSPVDIESDNDTDYGYCEIGVGGNTTGGYPLWIMIPAFAGTSIFGINAFGASTQGLPVYRGSQIAVECGPGGTVGACPDHPEYSYSPMWIGIEQSIGIYNGIFGLPEGVMPVPGHTHANEDAYLGPTGKWYIIPVFVLDPNIMPNETTGVCTQVIPSNLTNATGNCLDSFKDIFAAMNSTSTAVTDANGNNPIWKMFNHTTRQVVVPGITQNLSVINAKTGVPITFAQSTLNNYVGQPLNISAINLPGQSSSQPGSAPATSQAAIVAIIAIVGIGVVVALWRRFSAA